MKTIIREIQKQDNPIIENVIRTVLIEFGVNRPGTAFYDESLKHLYESYTTSKSIYFVALVDGEIIGGAGIFQTDGLPEDTCELVKMYLLPKARGLGLGRELITKCMAFAKEKGYKKIYLETMAELQSAVKIYQKLGFQNLTQALGNTGHFACTIRMIRDIHQHAL